MNALAIGIACVAIGLGITGWWHSRRQANVRQVTGPLERPTLSPQDSDYAVPTEAAALREYVDAELRRVVSADWPDLTWSYRGDDSIGVPLRSELWWSIRSPRMDQSETLLARHYLVEARADLGEFLVWFGALGGFTWAPMDPRPWMLPAVHVPFPPKASAAGFCGLGAVLRFMLQRQTKPEGGWDLVAFPMSGERY